MGIKKETIIEEVKNRGSFNTRKYRYLLEYRGDHFVIVRLERKYLNTTRAIDGWEVYYTSPKIAVKKYY